MAESHRAQGGVGSEHGHERDIAQVGAASAAQVGVAEAYEVVVAIVVARAPVPALAELGGPKLNQAEGHVGTHKHMAVAARPYHGIDILCENVTCSAGLCGRNQHKERTDKRTSDFLHLYIVS